MTIDISVVEFRERFPAMSDVIVFPDGLILHQSAMAQCFISVGPTLRGDCYQMAIYLMTAHLVWSDYLIRQGQTTAGMVTGATVSTWNGAISVTVIEPNADIPYTVLFDRPAEIPITVKVIMRSAQGTIDPNVVIPNALIAYAMGELDGERGFVTGVDVSPFELAGAISLVHPGFFVQQVLISRGGEALSSNEITIMKNEVATLSEENVSVVINL